MTASCGVKEWNGFQTEKSGLQTSRQVALLRAKHRLKLPKNFLMAPLRQLGGSMLRIVAWTARFIRNSRLKKQERVMGPLTTDEIKNQHLFWTKRPQGIQSDDVTDDRQRLGLEENDQGILICRSRVQVHYPVYLPDKHPYTVKLFEAVHSMGE